MKYKCVLLISFSLLCCTNAFAQLFPFYSNNKIGFKDSLGNTLIEPLYSNVEPFSNNWSKVKIGNLLHDTCHYQFINQKGNKINSEKYENANSFKNGYATVYKNKKWGAIDSTGKQIIDFKYLEIGNYNCGFFYFNDGVSVGYINLKGEILKTKDIKQGRDYCEGKAAVLINNKWGFIDTLGNSVIPAIYNNALNYSNGLAAVRMGNYWGFADTSGKIAITPVYDIAHNFNDSIAAVKIKGKWSYINYKGKEAFKGKFQEAMDYHNKNAIVEIDGSYGLINLKGEWIIKPSYNELSFLHENILIGMNNGNRIYLKTNGTSIVNW